MESPWLCAYYEHIWPRDIRSMWLTQAIFSKCQNSLCLLICICMTVLSVSLMLNSVLSILGKRSMIFCLLRRILLQIRQQQCWITSIKYNSSIHLLTSHSLNSKPWTITILSDCELDGFKSFYLRCAYRSLSTRSWFWTVCTMTFTISELSL